MKEKMNQMVEYVKKNPGKTALIVGGVAVVAVVAVAVIQNEMHFPEEMLGINPEIIDDVVETLS